MKKIFLLFLIFGSFKLLANINEELMAVSCCGTIEQVKEVLKNGADVNYVNDMGSTPLMGAAYSNFENVVELLIKSGANVNIQNVNGYTILMAAVWGNKYKNVKLIIDAGANINAVNFKDSETALLKAVRDSDDEIIELLIHHKADIKYKNIFGETAFDFAIKFNRSEKILKLLRNKMICRLPPV